MDINIVTTSTENDFIDVFNTIVDKFKIKDVEGFKNELLILVDSLNLKGNNDMDILEEKYHQIIEKYSTSLENIIDIALEEREKWQ